MGMPLADIIMGVIGGAGQVGMGIADRNDAKREKAFDDEANTGTKKQLAKEQVTAFRKQQTAEIAAGLLKQGQEAELERKKAEQKQTTTWIIIITASTVVVSGILVYAIKARKNR